MEKERIYWSTFTRIQPFADRSGSIHHALSMYVDLLAASRRTGTCALPAEGFAERRCNWIGRRQSELAWAESVSRFQSLIEQMPGISYMASLDPSGMLIYVSPKIEAVLGFSADQWCKDSKLRMEQLHEDDRTRVLETVATAIRELGSFSIDYRIHRRDGAVRWFHDDARVVLSPAGKALFLQGAVLDITDRKEAQADLERSHQDLQKLIAALDTLRTEEQRRLAHDLHDDFGQMLAAMKLDVSTLQQRLPQDDPAISRHLNSISELVDAMVASVRRIIADLPPKILEDAGLISGLQTLISTFEKRHGIRCQYHFPAEEPVLDAKAATAIYRIVQETLNNIAKHAQASEVSASIECTPSSLTLQVRDNGKGMANHPADTSQAFGLIGMRERVAALGGQIRVQSGEGLGTEIHVNLPIASPSAADPPKRGRPA